MTDADDAEARSLRIIIADKNVTIDILTKSVAEWQAAARADTVEDKLDAVRHLEKVEHERDDFGALAEALRSAATGYMQAPLGFSQRLLRALSDTHADAGRAAERRGVDFAIAHLELASKELGDMVPLALSQAIDRAWKEKK